MNSPSESDYQFEAVYILCDTHGYPCLVFKDAAEAMEYKEAVNKKAGDDEFYTIEKHLLK
jgi:hypothetical protein